MKTTKTSSLICGLLVIAAGITPGFSATRVVNQMGGTPYASITSALAVAANGDSILVMPGVYVEAITINATVTLISYGGPEVTIMTHSSDIVTISSGSSLSEIRGFTMCYSNGTGIYSPNTVGGTARVYNCIIRNNSGAGIYFYNHTGYTYNCIIFNNNSHGITYRADGADGIIANNVVFDNSGRGIYSDDAADPDIYNNVCYSNNDWGIAIESNAGEIVYNNSFSNGGSGTSNYTGFTVSPTNISSDPLFIDFPDDLHFNSASPCIDTGRPEPEYNDPNGTRSDMGLFGSTNCWGGGAPGVTSMTVTPSSVPQGGTINIQATGTVQ